MSLFITSDFSANSNFLVLTVRFEFVVHGQFSLLALHFSFDELGLLLGVAALVDLAHLLVVLVQQPARGEGGYCFLARSSSRLLFTNIGAFFILIIIIKALSDFYVHHPVHLQDRHHHVEQP